jgi:LysR family transcriptional regulator, low CO2-responsive transcriptional regulator
MKDRLYLSLASANPFTDSADTFMSFTFSRMRALNAVFEAGSFSSAARRLRVTQPAITQQIRDLERDYRITLFHRRSNGLVPTALCQELYAVTARIQSFGSEAERILSEHRNLESGELRIGLGNSMPGMALIGAMQKQFSGIRIHVELASWSTVIEAVVDRRVDVAVLPDVPNDGRFRRKVCLQQGVVAIAHPAHPIAGGRTVACADLIRHPLIFRTKKSSTQRVVDRAFRQAGFNPTPSIVLDTRDGVYEAAANELGVGFMWEHGSSRTDKIVKVAVPEMGSKVAEYVFCLAERKDALVELFFQARRQLPQIL